MKKLLAMCLVLSIATLANAEVLDLLPSVLQVQTYDVGLSGGRTGAEDSKLLYSDIIGVSVVVGYNYYAGYPAYSGYLVSSVDIDLHVVGAGSLTVNTKKLGGAPDVLTDLDTLIITPVPPIVNGPTIDRMQGISLGGIGAGSIIISKVFFHCEGDGDVLLDLTLLGLSEYAPYNLDGTAYPGYGPMTEQDLGDLMIYQIPEPMTMVLLGLGGLGLLRRRRR